MFDKNELEASIDNLLKGKMIEEYEENTLKSELILKLSDYILGNDLWVGDFSKLPDSNEYKVNSIAKTKNGLFINTMTGWVNLLENKDVTNHSGVGVSVNELNQYLDKRFADLMKNLPTGDGSTFTGTIDASAVNVNTSSMINISGSDLQDALVQIDSVLNTNFAFIGFSTSDVWESDTNIDGFIYVGYLKTDGSWYIKRVEDTGTEVQIRYASVYNNPTILTYHDAVVNREVLTYSKIEDVQV